MDKLSLSRRTVLTGFGATVLAGVGLNSITARAQSSVGANWQAGASPQWNQILKAARAEGEVTVGGFPALARKMSAAFERDTGIKMNYFGSPPSQLVARVTAEARAKNVTIDAVLGGGALLALIPQGLLQPIAPQIMLPHNAPRYFRDDTYKWMDSTNEYLFQGAEWVFGWLTVNKDIIDPAEITSWKDLLKPKYKGKIIAYDPRGPGPGQGATSWLYHQFGIGFVKDLFLGQEAKYTTDNRQVVESVARGTYPIGFAAIQFEVERFRREGFKNLAVVLPKDAPGYLTGGFSVLKQVKNVPRPNAAKVFINWYISQPGQEVYQEVMLAASRRKDVHTGLPHYLRPQPGIKYYEAYNEKVYFSRHRVVKAITDALGGR